MTTVNMHDAKSQLSKLVDAVEKGEIDEIIIARNGRPAARLVAIRPSRGIERRIGIAAGMFTAPRDPQADDDEAARLFLGSSE
ncbi:MAG: type II toxin-antitoxin system prevent-host-death family antitoxin [Caulobacter sp.]|jgi:prevent-host-death family protein|uniref:type II toxin-antitoxin system Phd/YefM family antitoxin n=1 Tax=Caulobacter sp. CCH9-E1 TaxID=1768768 RepID=UPI00082B59D3|nr:type II toxin-antitoxin system prevent-host-death family antitoxin [Caulobacter sp. CCH9-E1]MCK5908504.1 type II toxin-antitoxin system prevent-host-death family antitoxin [Caulobacter sp.]